MHRLKKHKGVLKLTLMVILSCVTQVVSLMKSSIVAGTFGVSAEMDAFNFANSISTFLFSFVIAGVSTIIIPCYVRQLNRKHTDSFITIIIGGMTIIATFVLLLRTPIISLVTGRDLEFVAVSGSVMIVLVVSNLFSILTSATSAYFQYAEKYNLPKLITLIAQTVVVVTIAFFQQITILQYAIIVGIGIIINSCFDLIFAVKSGWRYKPTLAVKDKETIKLLYTFIPVLLSTGIYQLSLMIDAAIASRLNIGDVTILNYSNQISAMINTLLVSNLLIYFYPKIVKDVENERGQTEFWEKTYLLNSIMCLFVAGYAVVGREGISLLFEHGKFDEESANLVFILSLIYISAQPINIVRDLIYRYFYAYNDTKSTTVNSITATIANIVFSLLLVKYIGIYGIVVGTLISSFVSLAAIMIRFKKKFGYTDGILTIIIQYCRTFLIAAMSIIVTLFTKICLGIDNRVVSILVFGIEVVILYIALTFLFNKKIRTAIKQL